MHPSQFKVNEAWIVFILIKELRTEHKGNFAFYGLMDAASCYLFGTVCLAKNALLDKDAVQGLLGHGFAKSGKYAKRIIVPPDLANANVRATIEEYGSTMEEIPERQMLDIIGEAQREFQERFG
jgi:hypothetical protein